MSIKYRDINPMQQPDRMACWSTSLSWWTKAMPNIKDYQEIEILGMYSSLIAPDGGLTFPTGYRAMLKDPIWGFTVGETIAPPVMEAKTHFKNAPVMCGYWESNVGGFHSVVLYDFKESNGERTIWAMDPNGAVHIKRDFNYYFLNANKTIFAYIVKQ